MLIWVPALISCSLRFVQRLKMGGREGRGKGQILPVPGCSYSPQSRVCIHLGTADPLLPPMRPIVVQPKARGGPSQHQHHGAAMDGANPWAAEPVAWAPLEVSARSTHLCHQWICLITHVSFRPQYPWLQLPHGPSSSGATSWLWTLLAPCTRAQPHTERSHPHWDGSTHPWSVRCTHHLLRHTGEQGHQQGTFPGQGDGATLPAMEQGGHGM